MTGSDPDLDALDALLKAATPGEWKAWQSPEGVWTVRAVYQDEQGCRVTCWPAVCKAGAQPNDMNAALIAAAVNALPKLIADARRARIGDAARAVLEMEAKLEAARAWFTAACRGEDVDESQRPNFVALDDAADAARARYRALVETKDA